MIRLRWAFVLLAVVFFVPLSHARPHNCEQRERSFAVLDQAEDALNKAKQLYPDCEEENESSNSSECSKKDKSLGFIDVALDLVSSAKKNIPICPGDPTKEPLTSTRKLLTPTQEPLTTTEEPTPEVTTEGFRPMDCQDLQAAGHNTTGVYTVWPLIGEAVQVSCDMDTDGGGWTVFQRRGRFRLFQQENFDRDWQDYKTGFGNLERDFWLGNDHIFALSNQDAYSLRMDMTSAYGKSAYAVFREFWIEDEKANYKLGVRGYSDGNAGDSMTPSNSKMFSTRDRNNNKGKNCAEWMKGGFWYDHQCAFCNPNGLYKSGEDDQTSVYYYAFKGHEGLASIDMKLKRL